MLTVNGIAAPENWESLPFADLVTLAREMGVVYRLDEEPIKRQLRQAIVLVSEVVEDAPLRGRRPNDRAITALRLRRTGMSWDAIAAELGYANSSGPYLAVKNHCARTGELMPRVWGGRVGF